MHRMLHHKSCQANAVRQARLLTEKVLYCDTDSIIYADDETKHIETGDILGDMTDELSGKKSLISFRHCQSHTVSNMVITNKNQQLKDLHLTMKTVAF